MPRFRKDTNSASFISELAQSIEKQGHHVYVLTPFDPEFKSYNRGFKVITYKYIWPFSLHKSGYSRVLQDKKMKPHMYVISSLMSLSALFHLVLLCRKYKIDVVTAHWTIPNGFIAYLAKLVTGVPYTITIPGSDVYLAGKNIFFKLTTRLAAMGAGYVISDSQHYLDQLISLDIKPKKTSVIRYGIDTDFLAPFGKDRKILSRFNIKPTDKVILGLGRFVEKKGFIYLIEAIPKILEKNRNAKLVLVGDGELKDEFLKKVQQLKIEKNLVFAGAVAYSDRASYYNLADIFVMPSIKDSLGNIDASPVAMMDAMSCGVPVIATKYSGSADLVIDGKTGWMVKEKNSNKIAEAANKLLAVKNKKTLQRNTRKIAIDNFSLESTAKKYLTIFNKIQS